jgi:hypothetical protein
VILTTFSFRIRDAKRYVVHFNISAFAPLSELSRFFFNFIFGGIFSDETSGILEYPSNKALWHIYVEIPKVPSSLKDSDGRTRDILQYIPLVKFLATEFVKVGPHIPLELTQGTR